MRLTGIVLSKTNVLARGLHKSVAAFGWLQLMEIEIHGTMHKPGVL